MQRYFVALMISLWLSGIGTVASQRTYEVGTVYIFFSSTSDEQRPAGPLPSEVQALEGLARSRALLCWGALPTIPALGWLSPRPIGFESPRLGGKGLNFSPVVA